MKEFLVQSVEKTSDEYLEKSLEKYLEKFSLKGFLELYFNWSQNVNHDLSNDYNFKHTVFQQDQAEGRGFESYRSKIFT